MKTRTFVGLLACLTLLFFLYVTPIAQSGPPGFASLFDEPNTAMGINSRGDIVGFGGPHAFLMPFGDATRIEQIDIENAVWTDLNDINDRGDMVGLYMVAGTPPTFPSFLLSAKGEFTELNFEGLDTDANGINDQGVVVGNYFIPDQMPPYLGWHAFLWWKGEFTELDNYPGAVVTWPRDINNNGDVVGQVKLVPGPTTPVYSYFMSSSGDFTIIGDPEWYSSSAMKINARGDIVGCFSDEEGGYLHGYLLVDGVLTTFDYPGADGTWPMGINKQGDIVGNVMIDDVLYGFLLSGPAMRVR